MSALAFILGSVNSLIKAIGVVYWLPSSLRLWWFRSDLLRVVVGSEPVLHVVIPHMPPPEFPNQMTGRSEKPPDNTFFLPLDHGIALAHLEGRFQQMYGDTKKVKFVDPQNSAAYQEYRSCIVLAGPFVNRMAKEILTGDQGPPLRFSQNGRENLCTYKPKGPEKEETFSTRTAETNFGRTTASSFTAGIRGYRSSGFACCLACGRMGPALRCRRF